MTLDELKERLTRFEAWLLDKPERPEGVLLAFSHRHLRIAYAVGRDVGTGNLTLHAMSLVYTTLLSIVPMLALSFSVLKAMGVHNQLMPFIYQFLEPLGARGEDIAENVVQFVDNIQVGVLGSVGLILLVYTVISLVQKIERSFNSVWRASQMRSMAQRFSNYLSVITVGPLLMVSGIGVSAAVFGSSLMQELASIEPFGTLISLITRIMPFLLTVAAFTFVYIFVPNTRVRLKSALAGGLVAGVAWQGASLAFANFAVGSTKYEAIYSSFAIGIMLLIWLYINWMILLVGSTISYYHQHERAISARRSARSSPELEERVALTLMHMVARAFDRGETPPRQELLAEQMHVPGDITAQVSAKLTRASLLRLGGPQGDELLPGRSLDQIRLRDVLRAVRLDEDALMRRLPDLGCPSLSDIADERLDRTLTEQVRA
ncbi:MAG: YhjD/YihY/BrkB family envelope integrity protein [Oleiphilaceae bacterium]|nr:YhjD/YihY/BrkB family envelope integrity protein [Oleiphilaceae bacterium]